MVDLGAKPAHFGTVSGGCFGDDEVNAIDFGVDAGETLDHTFGATGDGCFGRDARNDTRDACAPLGVRAVEPGGEADAAGDAVEFGDGEAVFGEEKVGTNHLRPLIFEGGGALEINE